ncbi:unnamed protein product [Polarella glacialis]|uniref:Uncharacterized protein n=1 Tax=Polarella glacialis TaxID=89957 RepID=A0A813KSN7_POLGL|nr:unnamed protein product [Polarella glacialis]
MSMGSWKKKRGTTYSKLGQVFVHPDDAAVLERCELVYYVLQAAPEDCLEKWIWTGSHRSVGRATKRQLLETVQEIWVCRGGQGPSQSEAITSATLATSGPLPPSDFVAAPDLNVAQFQ